MQMAFLPGMFDCQGHDCAGTAFQDSAFHKTAGNLSLQHRFAGIPKPAAPDWSRHGISLGSKHGGGAGQDWQAFQEPCPPAADKFLGQIAEHVSKGILRMQGFKKMHFSEKEVDRSFRPIAANSRQVSFAVLGGYYFKRSRAAILRKVRTGGKN
jgi:hypothetical protein